MSKFYVVSSLTRVQDGHEDGARIFDSLDAALAHINQYANPWGCTVEYALFELGKQIPLVSEQVEEVEQKVETKIRYSLKGVKK